MEIQRINMLEIGMLYKENHSYIQDVINKRDFSSEEKKKLFFLAFLFKKVAENYYTFINLLDKSSTEFDLNTTVQNLIEILKREKHDDRDQPEKVDIYSAEISLLNSLLED